MKLVTTNIQDATPVIGSKQITGKAIGSTAKVYFTKNIDVDHLIQLYGLINNEIFGKVAIKLHTGEPHGPNIIPPAMVQPFQAQIPDSTIVECNTLYKGGRYTTDEHRKTLETNGWTFSKVDIMDEFGTAFLPVRGGKVFQQLSVGKSGFVKLLVGNLRLCILFFPEVGKSQNRRAPKMRLSQKKKMEAI